MEKFFKPLKKKTTLVLIKENKFPPFKWKVDRRSFWPQYQYHHEDTTMTGTNESSSQ